jgi:hypothetical protein
MDNDDCFICLEKYNDTNKKIIIDCGSKTEHHICDKCFRKVKSINNLCPLCRSEIKNEPPNRPIDYIIRCLNIIIQILVFLIVSLFVLFFCYAVLSGQIKLNMGK